MAHPRAAARQVDRRRSRSQPCADRGQIYSSHNLVPRKEMILFGNERSGHPIADIGGPLTGKGFSLRLFTRIEPSYFGGESSLPQREQGVLLECHVKLD